MSVSVDKDQGAWLPCSLTQEELTSGSTSCLRCLLGDAVSLQAQQSKRIPTQAESPPLSGPGVPVPACGVPPAPRRELHVLLTFDLLRHVVTETLHSNFLPFRPNGICPH